MPDTDEKAGKEAAPPGRLHRLRENQSIVLDDPVKVWRVESGSLELLATRLRNGAPVGGRRHLFRMGAGNAVFGSGAGGQGWIGIATRETALREQNLADCVSLCLTDTRAFSDLMSGWVHAVGHFMNRDAIPPGSLVRIPEKGDYEFGKDEAFTASPDEFLWVRVRSGVLALCGNEAYRLSPEEGMLVLGGGLWLKVMTDSVNITAYSVRDPAGADDSGNGFLRLHAFFGCFLERLSEEDEEAEAERRRTGREQERLAAASAMEELSSLLNPRESFPVRESRLLTALSVVGQVLGVAIMPPAVSEDMARVYDPVDAVARASRVRVRKVVLGPGWWKSDSGPLLGYLDKERRPVALLPEGGGYCLVDPEAGRREPLTREVRDRINPDAYMMYRPLPDKLKGIGDLLRFTLRGNVPDMLFIVLMGALATLLGMLVPQVTGALVDTAILFADRGYVYQLAAVLTAAGIAGAAFTFVQAMATMRTSMKTEFSVQSAMWDRLLKFSPSFFRRFSSGDLVTRVNAVTDISRKLSAATLRPLVSGALALFNFALLWYYSGTLAMIALGIGLALVIVLFSIGYFVRRLSRQELDLTGKYNSLVIQMIGGVGKLRVAGGEQRAFNFWLSSYTQKLRLTLRVQKYEDGLSIINGILMPLCSAMLFWAAARLTMGAESSLSIGAFLAFNTAFVLYITGWTDLGNAMLEVLEAAAQGARVKPLLEESPEVKEGASDPGRLRGAVGTQSVSFRYAVNGPLILDGVSLEARPGEFIAVVGPSGSGKSTLLRILLGFEAPEYGRVLYDGQDLAGLDVMAVRRQLGTVLQHGRLNAGSILDNIANNARLTHAEIWEAAADAGLTADIEKMPMGLHTMVSEGGGNFSGGQRQRLLIARALALRNKIVMFDEATSALDNKTQAIVSEALSRRKVTRVVIAHRLSTIREADRIYVMDGGKIVQQGNFEELSGQEGLFRDLMSRQMI